MKVPPWIEMSRPRAQAGGAPTGHLFDTLWITAFTWRTVLLVAVMHFLLARAFF